MKRNGVACDVKCVAGMTRRLYDKRNRQGAHCVPRYVHSPAARADTIC